MIKIENTEVLGWEHAIRGMRNPFNSWGKSDSGYCEEDYCLNKCKLGKSKECMKINYDDFVIGDNDYDLMMKLRKGGADDRKYLRMITVYVDVTAPLYWWKEFDTYRVGVEKNSCSTMHKITAKEFTLDDFSTEHLGRKPLKILESVIDELNECRELYINGGYDGYVDVMPKEKMVWWQMIQLLPSSYNQRRTIMLNYEVLANMYKARKNHKLDEWREFCKWVESLQYSELITGERKGKEDEID